MSATDETPGTRDRLTSVGLFVATLVCVYWVYGSNWLGGDPWRDPEIAADAALFAGGLMSILLAHELGHYFVARAHGFRLSLPYFLPVPAAFGTFGAIIRLKSLPRSRTGLLEMGAAGPLAGFVVAILLIAIGLPGTEQHDAVEIVVANAAALLPPPEAVQEAAPWWAVALEGLLTSPPLSWIFPLPPPDTIPLLIMANPPIMDLLGLLILGEVPGRYAQLSPLAMAGWVGCLVTAINLVPIGQLDGGHIFNALVPRHARTVARIGLVCALVAGVLAWPGWAVWAVLLFVMKAWRSLPVPLHPPPSARARVIAVLAVLTFGLSFMPEPVQVEHVPRDQVRFVTPDGVEVLAPSAP
ncbi:MAG: site-2 protease family protein [Alphaproteobacteria bacterium]|nr:site-2 protease family protein [Alphaproteobacteria bacterium]